jgi:hypothetical protein
MLELLVVRVRLGDCVELVAADSTDEGLGVDVGGVDRCGGSSPAANWRGIFSSFEFHELIHCREGHVELSIHYSPSNQKPVMRDKRRIWNGDLRSRWN